MKKFKTTFIAIASVLAIFATTFAMLVFPAKGTDANASAQEVKATSLFSFTDADVEESTHRGYIQQATGITSYLTDGSLLTQTGAFGYSDYTNKGVYVGLAKSSDNKGNRPNDSGWGSGIADSNVVRSKKFSLTNNTKNDVLFSFKGAQKNGSRYQQSSEGGTVSAQTLLNASTLPYQRNQYVRIADANSDKALLIGFEYHKAAAGGTYELMQMRLYPMTGELNPGYAPAPTVGSALNVQRGGEVVTSESNAKASAIVPDMAWNKYNTMTRIYFDYEEKALYADIVNPGYTDAAPGSTSTVTQKALIRDFDDGVYGDSFNFDFEEVYIDFYFTEGGGETQFIFCDIDGVSLATDADGNLLADVAEEYNAKGDEYVNNTLTFTSIQGLPGEYEMPRIAVTNMLSNAKENVPLNRQYFVTVTDAYGADVTDETVVGLNDGRWTPEAKFNFAKNGTYDVKYTRGASVYTLKAFIAEYESMDGFLSVADSIDVTYDASAPAYMKTGDAAGEGIKFTWTTGGTININKEFDATMFDWNRDIVKVVVTPKVKSDYVGETCPDSAYEFERVTVRLYDAEDSNIYIDLFANASKFGNNTGFTSAAANGQVFNNRKVKDGTYSYGTYASNNGVATHVTFDGQQSTAFVPYYNNETYEVAVAKSFYKNQYTALDKFIIRDLDAEGEIQADEIPFAGFPSGKVKISITVTDALHDDASIILYEVMEQKVAGETIEDVTAPEIVDLQNFNEIKPLAQAGKEFPFPKVYAYDMMDGDVTDKVTATITAPGGTPVAITEDSFVPTALGTYTYTVTAVDELLNSSTKTFTFEAIKKLQNVYVDLKGAYPTTARVGDSVKVIDYEAGGGSGEISAEVFAFAPDGSEVDLSTSTINFTMQGLYEITYRVSDYIGVKNIKYYISVAYSDTPVISKVNVPVAILAGKSITLPKPTAYDYYSYIGERHEADIEVYVTEPGKQPVKLGADYKFTPTVESGNITVEYKAKALLDSTKVSAPDTYTMKVVKPTTLADYFIKSEGLSVSYEKADGFTEEAIFMTSTSGSSLTFINPLPAIGFTATIAGVGMNSMNNVDVILTDSVDPNQKVVINIDTSATRAKVRINGGEAKDAAGEFSQRGFALSYKAGNRVYDAENNSLGTVRNTVYGEAFNGFTSGKVYMEIVVNGVGENYAKFAVRQLVNQPRFTKALKDNQAPFISLAGEYTLYNTYGSEVVLHSAVAADILDPNAQVFLTVVKPDGETLFNNVPIDTPKALTLEQYGTYKLTYSAKDSSGNVMAAPYNLVAHDTVKPTIEVEGAIRTTYRVGDKLVLNKVKVSDNVTKPEDMIAYATITEHFTHIDQIYVLSEYGDKNEETGETNDFTFKSVGTYTLRIFVRDGAYNFSYIDATITVIE